MTEYKFGDEFSSVYKKAKVGSKELILSKGMIVLPMFNPNNKKELKEISLNEEQLLRSGYSSFVFEGYLMNSGLDFTFFKYIMCLAQKSNSRIIYIDFLDMVRDLGVESNHYSYYREAFAEHIHKGFHSRYTYTDLSGKTTNDRFYSRTEDEADGNLFLIEISSTVASSISSEYNQKLSYEESHNVKSGVASMLLEKIKVLAFSSEFNLRIDLFLHLLNLQGSRESKIKVLNRAIDNLIEVGFIVSCEDIKRGRRIDSKKLKINKKYDLSKNSEKLLIVEEVKPEFKELSDNLHKIEEDFIADDNLDDVFAFSMVKAVKAVPPAVISFSAGLDIMGCVFEEDPITDISGFDLEVDYDYWIDQSEIKRESTRVFEDEGFTDYNPMP